MSSIIESSSVGSFSVDLLDVLLATKCVANWMEPIMVMSRIMLRIKRFISDCIINDRCRCMSKNCLA